MDYFITFYRIDYPVYDEGSPHRLTPAEPIFRGQLAEVKEYLDGKVRHNLILLTTSTSLSKKRIDENSRSQLLKFSCVKDLSKVNPQFTNLVGEEAEGLHCNHNGYLLVICPIRCATKINPHRNWVIIEEHIHWMDLNDHTQTRLLDKFFSVQNQVFTLKAICHTICLVRRTPLQDVLNMVDSEYIVQLLNDEIPQISNANIPKLSGIYIQRKLKGRQRISRKVLSETVLQNSMDIFVFGGKDVQLYHLTPLVQQYGDGTCDNSSSQVNLPKLSVKNILLDKEEHFELISFSAFNNNSGIHGVHLVECIMHEEKIMKLNWLRTVGSIETLQRYVHTDQDIIGEEAFHSKLNSHVCIAGPPGTGKTYFLARCAQRLQTTSKTVLKLVQFVSSDVLVRNVSKIESLVLNNQAKIVKVLAALCSITEFGKIFLESILQENESNTGTGIKIRLELLLDGMDELDVLNYSLAKLIINNLFCAELFAVPVRIWVTTRLRLLNVIEEHLGTLGCIIQPLDTADQEKIISANLLKFQSDNYDFQAVKKFLIQVEKLQSAELAEEPVAGIPLLCVIMSSVLVNENTLTTLMSNSDSNWKTFYLSCIYDEYVKSIFRIRSEDHTTFMFLALRVFFPDIDMESLFFDSKESMTETDKLIESRHSTKHDLLPSLDHMHFTVFEYMAAEGVKYVFKKITEEKTFQLTVPRNPMVNRRLQFILRALSVNIVNIVVSKHTQTFCTIQAYDFNYKNICYFLSSNMAESIDFSCLDEQDILDNTNDPSYLFVMLWESLVAAILANYINLAIPIIQFLQKFDFLTGETISLYSVRDLILLSAKYTEATLLESVCKFCRKLKKSPIHSFRILRGKRHKFALTALHVAAESGNFSAFEYLMGKEKFKSRLHSPVFRNLLSSCLVGSTGDGEACINGKIQILKLITRVNPELLSENPFENSIVLERVQLDLLLLYVEMKSSFEKTRYGLQYKSCRNCYGENIFHLLATGHYKEDLTPLEYHRAVVRLNDILGLDECKKCLNESSCYGWRAVDVAIARINLKTRTIKKFKKLFRINLNFTDFRLSNPVYIAVAGNRSPVFIKRLVDQGVRIKPKVFMVSVLHLAVSYLNLPAVILLVTKYSLDVNIKDEEGNTPLHMCFQGDRNKLLSGIIDFSDNEFDFKSTFINKPAIPISRRPVQKLISGKNFNKLKQVEFCNRFAENCEPSDRHKIISFLLKQGAKIDILNKDGYTPLHFALRLCLGGLNAEESKVLQSSLKVRNDFLFSNSNYTTLALKGLLLNNKLGHTWNPLLLESFADKIIMHIPHVKLESFIFSAVTKHSYFGVQYILNNAKEALSNETMCQKLYLAIDECPGSCTRLNCARIKSLVLQFVKPCESKD